MIVLFDLLVEFDSFDFFVRFLVLIEGVLVVNIFDWGVWVCVEFYYSGIIFEIYRMSWDKMKRLWWVDDFDVFYERMIGNKDVGGFLKFYKCVFLFVDNLGVDIVFGMLFLVWEFLRRGMEVVFVVNFFFVINDVIVLELFSIVVVVVKYCEILWRVVMVGGFLVDVFNDG